MFMGLFKPYVDAQIIHEAAHRREGEVKGDSIYTGRAGVGVAYLRAAEVLARPHVQQAAPQGSWVRSAHVKV